MAFTSADSELLTTELLRKCVKSCMFLQIGFWQISRYLSILGHMLLHKLDINVAIANILLCRITLQDLPEPNYKNLKCRFVENGFSLKSRSVLILGHVLLHKLYINVVIANIILRRHAFQSLQKLEYKQFAEKT